MHHFTKPATAASLVAAALALSACGMVDSEAMIAEIDEQCRASFMDGSEDNGQIFCDCQSAKMRESDMGPLDLMDEEKMRAISDECGEEVMNAMRESWNL